METILGLFFVILKYIWVVLSVVIKVLVYIIGFIPIVLIRIAEWLSVLPQVWPFPDGFF